MDLRPDLDKNLFAEEFLEYYWLKEELVDFCRKNGLRKSGGKIELTERISVFLRTGDRSAGENRIKRAAYDVGVINLDMRIEENFVCSEKHRAFYKEHIGKSFTFNVAFQKWLKVNSGKTYRESIDAYYKILADKKKNKTEIDRQFEYNTYIRDFFADMENKGKTLAQAIKCWKFKKSQKGHNRYELDDLKVLELKTPERSDNNSKNMTE